MISPNTTEFLVALSGASTYVCPAEPATQRNSYDHTKLFKIKQHLQLNTAHATQHYSQTQCNLPDPPHTTEATDPSSRAISKDKKCKHMI